jgi:PTS system mannose-specific IID component
MKNRGVQKRMFLRSLFVQASWNFEGLQNLGFFLLVYPALAKKHGLSVELGSALKRHLDFFNTHPYFAGLVAGAVVHEEGGDLDRGRFLEDLKRSLMSTLASIGDGFFWATLKPLAILTALLPAIYGVWWAPLVLLVLFNVPHLYLRWWGIRAGLEKGCRVIESVKSLPLAAMVPVLKLGVAGMAGLCAGAAVLHPRWAPVPGEGVLSVIGGGAVFLASVLLSARKVASRRVLTGAARILLLGIALAGTMSS